MDRCAFLWSVEEDAEWAHLAHLVLQFSIFNPLPSSYYRCEIEILYGESYTLMIFIAREIIDLAKESL